MTWKKIFIATEPIKLEQRVPAGTKPNTQNPAGRVCSAEGCDTKLSIYNSNPTCAQHGGSTVAVPIEKLFPEFKEKSQKGRNYVPKTPAEDRRFDAPRGRRPKKPPAPTFAELYEEFKLERARAYAENTPSV